MSRKQLRSEQSISIQGRRRAKITYHTHATVVRHELKYIPNRRTRDQAKYFSMTKVEKPHYRELKAQRREKTNA